jgi:hypothetical protein
MLGTPVNVQMKFTLVRRRISLHDPHTLRGMLSNFELLEAQVASIIRGPHLRLLTAIELNDMHRRLDAEEARLREAAMRIGLDAGAPMATLRRQVRTLEAAEVSGAI